MLDGLTAGLLERSELWPDICYLLFVIVCGGIVAGLYGVRYHIRAMQRCEQRRRESEAACLAEATAERERIIALMDRQSDRNQEFTRILTEATSALARLEAAMNRRDFAQSVRNGE